MSLSSIQLDAFMEVAREASFSRAAEKLHITQSALSQRIANLESYLGSTLFIRDPGNLRLTELGSKLLRYGQSKEVFENEFLENIKAKGVKTLAGTIRIAGFSTITKSILIPIIGDFVKEHPLVQVDIQSRELHVLPKLLESGQSDFIFLDRPIEKQGVENILLGYEENVLIQPRKISFRENVYLDNDEQDLTTREFFKNQKKAPKKWQRSYLDEIYLIIEGVLQGLGRAVVPMHIAKEFSDIEIMSEYKSLKSPIYLVFYAQAFYTQLQQIVIEWLKNQISQRLLR